jgi:sec-independent protein translocase protein TatC
MKRVVRSIWQTITAPFRALISYSLRVIHLITSPFQKIKSFFIDTSQVTENPFGDALGMVVNKPGLLLPHLNALRKHVFRSILAIIFLSILTFSYIKPILQFLASPLPGGLDVLTAIDITENIGSVMKVALLVGFAVSIPYLAFEVYMFFAPAIKPSSRLRSLLAIPLALLFFCVGMAFAYYVMLPVALPFLFNFMGLATQPRPSSYFSFITAILFWMGIFCEFPLVVYLLASVGLLQPHTLKAQWRLAIIIIAILSAAITPTIDPINMGLVMGPMLILYWIAILFASVAQKRHHNSKIYLG